MGVKTTRFRCPGAWSYERISRSRSSRRREQSTAGGPARTSIPGPLPSFSAVNATRRPYRAGGRSRLCANPRASSASISAPGTALLQKYPWP